MPVRVIHAIVIHCSASANGVSLARVGTPGMAGKTSAQVIDGWHAARGFCRRREWARRFQPQFNSLGYHFVIDIDGTIESGRHVDEQGAHVYGHNRNTIGICVIGTDSFTREQWQALRMKVRDLLAHYPHARVCGHRDLSPDADGDGAVERHEWLKICPGFDVPDWHMSKGMQPLLGHIVER